jgi:hypothetical protein
MRCILLDNREAAGKTAKWTLGNHHSTNPNETSDDTFESGFQRDDRVMSYATQGDTTKSVGIFMILTLVLHKTS